MEISIRQALPNDMESVLGLIKELALYENEPDAVSIDVDTLIKSSQGDQPLFTCFVAEVDKHIVGIALVYFRFSTWKGKIVHLEDLIVTESYRNKGVGSLLYNAVMRYAKKQEVKRVSWEVLDWNTGAIDFYERSGAEVLKDWHVVHFTENRLDAYLKTID